MAILPVGNGDGARTMTAQQIDRRADEIRRGRDAPIGPVEIFAPGSAEHPGRVERLGAPLVGRAVAAKFAAREVAKAH